MKGNLLVQFLGIGLSVATPPLENFSANTLERHCTVYSTPLNVIALFAQRP